MLSTSYFQDFILHHFLNTLRGLSGRENVSVGVECPIPDTFSNKLSLDGVFGPS